MPKRRDKNGPELPSLLVARREAVERLSLQIERGRDILSRRISSRTELKNAEADRSKWFAFTRELLLRLFDTSAFADELRGSGVSYAVMGPTSLESEIRDLHTHMERDITKLESILGRLELIPEHAAATVNRPRADDVAEPVEGLETVVPRPSAAGSQYLALGSLHAEVRAVSEKLFLDGYFAQAIFEAFKAVNARVKANSLDSGLDGKKLMARVFRPEDPILKLNELSTTSEKDEQEGFMHIFMGAIQGIRNPKAHDVVTQEDPQRAVEYLALASLLMRRIDDALLLKRERSAQS